MTRFYIALPYQAYKRFEQQCVEFRETVHTSHGPDTYHKAFVFDLDGQEFEVVGPTVLRPKAVVGQSNSKVLVPVESDAPTCYNCGWIMRRTGSCYSCDRCGTTTGCG